MPAAPPRPILPATLIGAAAQFLFTLNITRPSVLVFDEVHYIRAARLLRDLFGPTNIEHPLLGKLLIVCGMRVFGDNQLGWRIPSTIAATLVVLGAFWILWLLFHRTRTAVIGALFVTLNITVFIQARIGMLDGFMAAFLVLAIVALLRAAHSPPDKVWQRWLLGSALLGLAVAVKWAAAPYVAFAAIAFIVVRRQKPDLWPGLPTLPALAALGLVSIATYFLTFAPTFFYANEPMTLAGLLPFQKVMYLQQTQVLPSHPYQSSWWTWPFMVRPIWYLYEVADGAQRGILLLGNPAILWGGLVAVGYCLKVQSLRMNALAWLWIASLAMWAIIPKSLGFFYYYYPSTIWLCLALAAAFDHLAPRRPHWDEAFLAAVAVLFVYFYPIISAAALPDRGAFQHWMWFPTWP